MKNNDDFKKLTFSVGYSSILSTSFGTLTHLISHIDSVSCNIPSSEQKTETQEVKRFIQVLYWISGRTFCTYYPKLWMLWPEIICSIDQSFRIRVKKNNWYLQKL